MVEALVRGGRRPARRALRDPHDQLPPEQPLRSPRLDGSAQGACPAGLRDARAGPGERFTIKGNPLVERDFIYVGDVVDVFARSLAIRETSDALNLCRGETTTLLDLARTILEVGGRRPARPRPRHGDPRRARPPFDQPAAARALRECRPSRGSRTGCGRRSRGIARSTAMPGPERDIVIGADGFLGRNLVPRLRAEAARSSRSAARRATCPTGPMSSGRCAPPPGRPHLPRGDPPADRRDSVRHPGRAPGDQRPDPPERPRGVAPVPAAGQARLHGLVLHLSGIGRAPPEARFGQGPTHPSVIGYGLAKQVLATGSAAYAHQYGLSFLHCVLATLYGPHDNTASDRSHFVGALLDRAVREKAAGAQAFEVWGNPQTIREVLHVDDQIDAILAADRAFDNEILNCAANTPVTVEAVARAALAASTGPSPCVSPPAPSRARPTRCSTRRASSTGPAGGRASISKRACAGSSRRSMPTADGPGVPRAAKPSAAGASWRSGLRQGRGGGSEPPPDEVLRILRRLGLRITPQLRCVPRSPEMDRASAIEPDPDSILLVDRIR